MRAIRNKNTRPELTLHAMLEGLGFSPELHVRDLAGTPDFVLREHRIAIFMHGCFWHGHDCYLFRMPAERRDFWENKIAGTRKRDAAKREALLGLGWRVLDVWECALKGRLRQPDAELSCALSEWISSTPESPVYAYHSLRCVSDNAGSPQPRTG